MILTFKDGRLPLLATSANSTEFHCYSNGQSKTIVYYLVSLVIPVQPIKALIGLQLALITITWYFKRKCYHCRSSADIDDFVIEGGTSPLGHCRPSVAVVHGRKIDTLSLKSNVSYNSCVKCNTDNLSL